MSGLLCLQLFLGHEHGSLDGIEHHREKGILLLGSDEWLYGGCRCAKIERITKPDGPETEVVTIAAGTRQEEENE